MKPMRPEDRILDHLRFLYGSEQGQETWKALQAILDDFRQRNPHLAEHVPPPEERLTERDSFLITYADQVREPGQRPLRTLGDFLATHVAEVVHGVHLLPFFPYSSDDGFSVIDYYQVNPDFGTWDDVAAIGQHVRLMFDAVINHISRQSAWFQAFLRGESPYTDFFIVVDPSTDLSQVVRPRATPLLTPVETAEGVKYVWTTFSSDQVDLNYKNPAVLLEILKVLLFYVEKGADVIRLDAIAYLWKEIGTPCIHLPQTHRVVKLFRAVLDAVAPGVILITETNVPHEENISYFGDGTDEAQMVYNFALPPLVLHTFRTGNAERLTRWAQTLSTPSPLTTFFNFIASHDGIGVMPARGLLSEAEIQALVDQTLAHGGRVSYKANPDGSKSVYELNITLYDALNDPHDPDPERDVARFMASQVIMLSLAGVPGIYVHSLFGSRNCYRCLEETGHPRSINREKFDRATLEAELADPTSLPHRVFEAYRHLLAERQGQPAFHPNGPQRVLALNPAFFTVVRTPPPDRHQGRGAEAVLCLVNVTPDSHRLNLSLGELELPPAPRWHDLIGGGHFTAEDGRLRLSVSPYQALWLVPQPNTAGS